jgi:hypothetical protein
LQNYDDFEDANECNRLEEFLRLLPPEEPMEDEEVGLVEGKF